MDRSNVDFLTQQTKLALRHIFGLEYHDQIQFIIEVDNNDKSELKTNFDEIMNFWILPNKVGHKLSLDEIADILTTTRNELPLWITLEEIEDRKLFKMIVSKRFRKLKVIRERHVDSLLIPFFV